MGFTGLRAKNRLYVRGDYARHIPGLLPDQFASPRARVDPNVVKSAVQRPQQRARTYVCMERVMAGGQLVVGMYVRAWLEQDLLSIERVLVFSPSAAEPLPAHSRPNGPRCHGRDLGCPRYGDPQDPSRPGRKAGIRKASQRLRGTSARSRGKGTTGDQKGLCSRLRSPDKPAGSRRRLRHRGAFRGSRRPGRRQAAEPPASDCIQEFLDDHGVDTSEFKQQVQLITNQVSNIGTLQAGTALVGGQGNIVTGHGAVNNFGSGQAAQSGTGIPQVTP